MRSRPCRPLFGAWWISLLCGLAWLNSSSPAFARVPDHSGPHLPPAQARATDALQRSLGPEGVLEIDRIHRVPRLVARVDGYLTGRRRGRLGSIVRGYLRRHRAVFRLDLADLAALHVARDQRMRGNVHRLVLEQRVDGVPALGAGIIANLRADGRVLNLFGPAVPDLSLNTADPGVGRARAMHLARRASGADGADDGALPVPRFREGSSSQLVAYASSPRARLAWRILNRNSEGQSVEVAVDAETGAILKKRLLGANAVQAQVFDYYPGAPAGGAHATRDITPYVSSPGGPVLEGDNVYAFSDPNADDFVSVSENVPPAGGTGDDYLYDYEPINLGPSGNCPAAPYYCSWDTATPFSWEDNADRAAVQLFYSLNRFHDYLHAPPIDFTAAKGAFEGDTKLWAAANWAANTGTGALSGLPDPRITRLFLGNGFFEPNPGGSPIIRMALNGPDTYAFGANALQPDEPTINVADDSSFVYHENAHGLSLALISDAQGEPVLEGRQARALGEAWSDWYAMDFIVGSGYISDTATPGEVRWAAYLGSGRPQDLDCPVGGAALQCPAVGQAGSGGFTYGDYGHIEDYAEPHGDGTIWSQTLWDLRRRLIADHGEATGVNRARLLITAAIELSPPDPSFLDERNALLQADLVHNGGQDESAIWDVFANRGMGYFASTTGPSDPRPVENFALPPAEPWNGRLRGVVTTQFGKPVRGARVSVGGFGGTRFDLTDSRGRYEIPSLAAGTYPHAIAASPVAGFDDAVASGVTIPETGAGVRNFSLKRDWAARRGGASIVAQVGNTRPADPPCRATEAIDQDFSTGWLTNSPANPAQPGPKSITVKLPKRIDLTSLAIDPDAFGCFGGSGSTASIRNYRIKASTNRRSFKQIAAGAFTPADVGERNIVVPRGGIARSVRFVRVIGDSTQSSMPGVGGATYMVLTEVQVYGKPHRQCIVPRVIGKRIDPARAAIRAAHCGVGRISRRPARNRAGVVVHQSLRPGLRRPAGTPINLVVGRR